jgi:hypothetical protein
MPRVLLVLLKMTERGEIYDARRRISFNANTAWHMDKDAECFTARCSRHWQFSFGPAARKAGAR